MPAVGSILEFIMKTTVEGYPDQILNVFHYQVIEADGEFSLTTGGQKIASDWFDHFSHQLEPMLHTSGFIGSAEINNLSNPLEFWKGTLLAAISGTLAGELAPIFLAWGFEYQRATKTTRNGSKRFSPIGEAGLINGNPSPAMVAAGIALSAKLDDTVTVTDPDGTVILLQPMIVRKTSAPLLVSNAVSGVSFKRVTTQNTRKPGRGI